MKNTIKRWCVRLGLFIAKLGGYEGTYLVVPSDDMAEDVLKLAVTLTKRQDDNWPDRDGEAKRAAVYAELTNIYPRHDRRMISRAIEGALACGG